MTMREYCWVAIGGGIGAFLRSLIAAVAPLQNNLHIMWINIVGSLLLAIIYTVFSSEKLASQRLRLLLGVGVMGGFTTMSTFSLDIFLLLESGSIGTAIGYMLGSVCGASLATVLGVKITRLLKRKRGYEA